MSLTPKMFDMLLVLVERHGQVVDKETFLCEVWPDSFVEEGNIAFNIRQLRKILGDDAQSPIYIETVPRRGYRFIAEVESVAAEPPAGNGFDRGTAQTLLPEEPPARRHFLWPIGIISALLVCGIAAISWYFWDDVGPKPFPILAAPFTSEKLSTTGNVFFAAISPDGKTVAYSSKTGGKQSLWLRQLDSGSNVPLLSNSDGFYYGLLFSPDGNSIYFTRADDALKKPDIYRVSILGGIPERIVSEVEGPLSISPDSGKISFVRCPHTEDEWCNLWIADASDGGNERTLTSRPSPNRIADIGFSPDGSKIAFATGQSRNAANEFQVMEYDLIDKTERAYTSEKFFNIKNLAWLPDQSGLLLTASRIPNKYFRVWQVTASTGEAQPLTKDSEAYSILSMDRGANTLVSTQIKQDFRMLIYDVENELEKRLLAAGVRPTFSSDGKIYFASVMSGNDEIWTISPNGEGQRQLTSNLAGEGSPIVSPDGKTIFFTSNRSGEAQIWRMNADGTDQTQVTQNGASSPLFAPNDGKSFYYAHAVNGTLWQVSLENGAEKLVQDRIARHVRFSPVGTLIAGGEQTDNGPALIIRATSDASIVHRFELSREGGRLLDVVWLPDGKSLFYLASDAEYGTGAVYQQHLNGGTPRLVFDLGDEQLSEIAGLAVSPDGGKIVVVVGDWKHDAVLIKGLN